MSVYRFFRSLILGFTLTFSTVGCGSVDLSSMFLSDKITSYQSSVKTRHLRYQNILSINGLMPYQVPGIFFHDPNVDAGFFSKSKITPGNMIGLTDGKSMIVANSYSLAKGNDGADIVKTLLDQYNGISEKAMDVVTLQAKVTLAGIAANVDDKAKYKGALFGALGVTKDTVGSTLTDLTSKLNDAQGKLDTARNTFEKYAIKNNVVVMQWSDYDEKSGGGNVSGLVSAKGKSNKSLSGVLFLADLRTLTLFAGSDFFDIIKKESTSPWFSLFMTEAGAVTYVLQAKHLAYKNNFDRSSAVALSLNLSESTLNTILKDKNISLDLEAAFASATSVSNQGILSKPTTELWFFPFDKAEGNQADNALQRFGATFSAGNNTMTAVKMGQCPAEKPCSVGMAREYQSVSTVQASLTEKALKDIRKEVEKLEK